MHIALGAAMKYPMAVLACCLAGILLIIGVCAATAVHAGYPVSCDSLVDEQGEE